MEKSTLGIRELYGLIIHIYKAQSHAHLSKYLVLNK